MAAMSFRVNHDAPEPAGFVIKTPRETVIFAIDSNEWLDDVTAIASDYLFIEANYDPTLMEQEQFSLRRHGGLKEVNRWNVNERIKASHMSIDKTLATISKIDKTRLKTIFLTHLSDRMSAPQYWKTLVKQLTGIPCSVCRKDEGLE